MVLDKNDGRRDITAFSSEMEGKIFCESYPELLLGGIWKKNKKSMAQVAALTK